MSIIKTLNLDIISRIHELIDENISPEDIRSYIFCEFGTFLFDEDIIDYIRNYCDKEWLSSPNKKQRKIIQKSGEVISVLQGMYIDIKEITPPTTEDTKTRNDDLGESIEQEKSSNNQSTENIIKNDANQDKEKHHQSDIEESGEENDSEETSYEQPIDSSSCEDTTSTIKACPEVDAEDLKGNGLEKLTTDEQPSDDILSEDTPHNTVAISKADIDHLKEENNLSKESSLEKSKNNATEHSIISPSHTNQLFDTLEIIDYLKAIHKGITHLDESNRNLSSRLTKLENKISEMQSNNPYVKVQKFADDLINIYANEKSKKSVNVNPLINDRIIDAMAKKYNITNNNSLAVNTALLLALYKSGLDDIPDKK